MNKIIVWKSYEKEEDVHGLERFEKPKSCHGTWDGDSVSAHQIRFGWDQFFSSRLSKNVTLQDYSRR